MVMTQTIKALRPKFHVTGERGWINDPNGLVKFNGEYHVFFQYYPNDTKWGPMHWGHVKSSDLTHWERLPVALFPDEQDDGCFSGSAIVWDNKLWVMYTGFTDHAPENEDGIKIRQLQCLASSEDGVHFEKHGIVIGEDELPAEYCPWDFRDPKLFEKDGKFYCLVAAKKRDGRGRIILFESDDLFKWKFTGDLWGEDCGGIMTECPDYRQDLNLLTYCEQFQPRVGNKHLNVHSTFYRLGELDLKDGRFKGGESEIIDYGFDFYAPQTFLEEPVMIGWLDMWDRTNPTDKYGFAGMLTVPRRLKIKNGRLWQTPIYKGTEKVYLKNCKSISGNLVSGVVKLEAKGLKSLSLKLRKKGDKFASLTLKNGEWVFDRKNAGESITGVEKDEYSLAQIRTMPFDGGEDTVLEVVVDLFSVEIFADGRALSSIVVPEEDADGLELELDAESCIYRRFSVE